MIVKNFRNKRAQTIIIMLIILLSTMLINGALSVIKTIKTPINDLVKECNLPETVVYTHDLPDEMLKEMKEDFENIEDVENVYEVNRYYMDEDKFIGESKLDALLFLTEYNSEAYKNIRCIYGNVNVDSYKDNQCAIPGCVANDQNINVGDVINIKFTDGERGYEVAGIYADPDNMSIAFSSNMYIKKLPDNIEPNTILAIDVKNSVDPFEVESTYRREHDGKIPGQIITLETRIDQQLMMVNILGGVLLGIGIGSFAICILIIIFIVKNAIVSDTKKISIYKTYGYQYRDIAEMYLGYYTAVVLFGSILGVLASIGLASVILEGVFRDMGAKVVVNPFYPGCMSVIVVTILAFVCIWLVIRKTKNIKPVFALRGETSSNTKKKKSKGGMGVSFSPFGIAVRSILRDKRGAAGTAIASIAVVFLTNFGVVALEGAMNMESENDYWLGIPASEVVVEVTNISEFDNIIEILESDADVEKAIPWVLEKGVTLPWKEGVKDTAMYLSIYEDYDEVNLELLEGRNPKTKDEIALASKIVDKLNLKIGDYITLSLNGSDDISMLVTGIYQTYYDMGIHGRVTSEAYTARDIPMDYEKIAVYTKENVDVEKFIDKYAGIVGDDASVIKREECCKSIMTMIANPQKVAIPPVVALIILIGGISIFSIVLLRNMKNEKTNQIYKSIGYTTRDLYVSNIWYVMIIGIIAMAIGVPALLLCYKRIMILALQAFGLKEYRMHINVLTLVITNVLTLLCFAISSLISSRKLRRLNVRDLVIE